LDGSTLRVLYHGSIVPARLPTTVLTALATLPECVRLRVVGYETIGHKGYVRQLQELAARLGICRPAWNFLARCRNGKNCSRSAVNVMWDCR